MGAVASSRDSSSCQHAAGLDTVRVRANMVTHSRRGAPPMQSTITTLHNTAEGWERALYAFLAEKERRSGSRRTVEGYSRMVQHFPTGRRLRQQRQAARPRHQPGDLRLGLRRRPLRQAAVVRHDRRLPQLLLSIPDPHGRRHVEPCDALQRPRVQVSPPRGLGADAIRRLRAVIPETPVGPARPGDHPDADAHRAPARRGAGHDRGRPEPGGRARLVPLPGEGRQDGQAGAATARVCPYGGRCRPSRTTWRPWGQMRRCGPHVAATRAGSGAAPSTATCSGTSGSPGCRRRVCIRH